MLGGTSSWERRDSSLHSEWQLFKRTWSEGGSPGLMGKAGKHTPRAIASTPSLAKEIYSNSQPNKSPTVSCNSPAKDGTGNNCSGSSNTWYQIRLINRIMSFWATRRISVLCHSEEGESAQYYVILSNAKNLSIMSFWATRRISVLCHSEEGESAQYYVILRKGNQLSIMSFWGRGISSVLCHSEEGESAQYYVILRKGNNLSIMSFWATRIISVLCHSEQRE